MTESAVRQLHVEVYKSQKQLLLQSPSLVSEDENDKVLIYYWQNNNYTTCKLSVIKVKMTWGWLAGLNGLIVFRFFTSFS